MRMSLTSCMALLSFSLSPAVAGEKTAKTDKLKPAAFDSMRHGSCHAGNKASDPKAIGGYGASTNFPKPLPKGEKLRGKKLYLEITGKEDAEFPGKFEGMEIRLVNGGAKTASISASDSRLSLVQEAKDADGEWKPVESLPRTFCGNSYHHVYLKPEHFWSFVVPKYSGPVKTKLRLRLTVDSKTSIVSDSFAGSIHPGQFISPLDSLAIESR